MSEPMSDERLANLKRWVKDMGETARNLPGVVNSFVTEELIAEVTRLREQVEVLKAIELVNRATEKAKR